MNAGDNEPADAARVEWTFNTHGGPIDTTYEFWASSPTVLGQDQTPFLLFNWNCVISCKVAVSVTLLIIGTVIGKKKHRDIPIHERQSKKKQVSVETRRDEPSRAEHRFLYIYEDNKPIRVKGSRRRGPER